MKIRLTLIQEFGIFRSLLLALCFLLSSLTGAFAATLNINEDGLLIGATNVDIDGAFYDVQFRDSSFTEIFGDASGLDATTVTQAIAFSHALLNQVFLDTDDGLFDTDPELTFGCPNTLACFVFTPFSVDTNSVESVVAINRTEITLLDSVRSDPPVNSNIEGDFSQATTWVYADWSTATRVIPVPAAIWLFGSGLLGLIGIARRKKKA